MTEKRCGCCEGTSIVTPTRIWNRPGLNNIRYRVGTHSTFLETMVARLSSHRLEDGQRPLERLTTRAADDPAIALLDGWATVADVLTFYQERIANEGYLLTATERRSILELARLVGYRLRPGVAASVYLAFTLEKDYHIVIPKGTRAQSIPGPGELPQFFETDEDLPARTEWNAIPARPTRPSYLRPDETFFGTRSLRLEGAVNNVRAGDTILFACGETFQPYTVQSAEADAAAAHTLISYAPFGGPMPPPPPETGAELSASGSDNNGGSGGAPPALTRLKGVVTALSKAASVPPPSRFQLPRSAEQTYSAKADLGPRLLTHFDPSLKDTLYQAYAAAPVTATAAECEVHALPLKAAPFGSTAPPELVFNENNVLVGRREWMLAEFLATGGVRLTSTEGETGVLGGLGGSYDLRDSVNPLRLRVVLGDGEGGIRFQQSWDVRDLVVPDQPPFGEDDPEFTLVHELEEGGAIAITAAYQGDFSEGEYSGAVLRHLEVEFRLRPGQETSIRIVPPPPIVIAATSAAVSAAASGLQVDVDGTVRTPEVRSPISETIGRRTIAILLTENALNVTHRTPLLASNEQLRTVSLDGVHDGIVAGSYVVIEGVGPEPVVAVVERVRTVSRADYGISGRVTQLVLSQSWLGASPDSPPFDLNATLGVLRRVTIHARSEELSVAEEVIEEDVAGDSIELDGLYDGLEAGRWLMVKGVRSDIPGLGEDDEGVEATELVMLAGVEHVVRTVTDEEGNEVLDDNGQPIELPGDTLHTRLILSEPLAYTYRREGFTVNANVVRATHGETKTEVLGSGDGRVPFQSFTLKQKPLTYLPAPTPSGVESTLEVRVNEVRWPEQETLLGLEGNERGYTTRTDDEGNTTVIFGDGLRGARLPTGVENVTAVYRAGIGKGGNVGANEISVLATRPLGVKEVINPQRASGGADPESRDQARRNVPVAVLALDRLVSVRDYADFARVFAGIGKASAASISDGRRQVVHLTIAGADDIPIDPTSELYRNLLLALSRFGDPNVPLVVAPRELVILFLSARVKVGADYLWALVEPKIRAALLEALGFDRRDLGQDVRLSEVISVIQSVEGVEFVDVDLLDGIAESDVVDPEGTLDPEALAARLEALAAATGATSTGSSVCTSARQPRQRVTVELARIDPSITDPDRRIRPAQIAYLNPELPDTLVLTEVTS
ncbi:MAG TPA: putative baseplate assembly protein [Longimicrobiaceae bacterium]